MKKTVAVIALIVIALVGSSQWYFSNSQAPYLGTPEMLVLGYAPTEAAGLVYIAEAQGFFAANGVVIVHRPYDTGATAIQALLNNEVDIAGVSEVPFVNAVFQQKPVSMYATLAKVQYAYLIGRKDRGIQTPADLRGKKIGLPRQTMAEFYLGRFLELQGLKIQDVTLVETAPPAAMDALNGGTVDGVVVWNPFAHQLRQQWAEQGTFFQVQSGQAAYAASVARNDWIAAHSELLKRSLIAIVQAEQFTINRPAEAKAIVQKRMNYDAAFMDSVWSENQYALALDRSLIAAMEDEARWLIANNLTAEKRVPDFTDYVYVDALKAVKPGAVNIIR
ncbi:MAG: NrtA/SsuA/CpmA family ABC transporter substrate-binding protein [Chloroflexi bacterium]|nr:NrtA/SsuA/CpmA family ABC transporter substrate-binding protein [Chloroflexota bacterium]